MISDERYKELMGQVGMPDSVSLMLVLKQVANEVTQEQNKQLAEALQVLTAAYNFCTVIDCDGDELNPTLALRISKVIQNIRK